MSVTQDILIVDDEADIRSLISGVLADEGYAPRQAANDEEAFAAVALRRPDLIILDIWLKNSRLDGLGILEKIIADHPNLPILMISGHGTIETAVLAIKKGAYDFIEKPFKTDRLIHMVERAIEAARLRRENNDLRQRADINLDVIGRSSGFSQLMASIEKVGPTNSRVLITGPAGAGKEVAARMLHQRSNRGDGPLVVLNCANLKANRLEVELFGRESVDSTGQAGTTDRPQRLTGTFEQAHNGTLYLDEVADMPMETQGKIVRILQEQRFRRVGGQSMVEVDVRVIASTSKELNKEIAAGRFREDLYYRLNVVPLRVPYLRERREDIPVLVEHFMVQSARIAGRPQRSIGDDAMAILQAYDWPGNVRQLRNVIDWLMIMAPGQAGDPIRADMLPPEFIGVSPGGAEWDRSGEILGMPLRDAREVFEREYLEAQVNRFGGNISRTAAFVGMERSALHRKLRALGVSGNDRGAVNE